ncbi:MAG: hypothetical protein ACJ74U_15390 [Jatrophihabitantaceae bacterium]
MAGIGSCLSDPLGCPGQIIGGAASDAADSGLKALADGAFDFLGSVLKLLTTFWLAAPTPDLTSPASAVARLQAQLQPLAAFALVIGLLAAAARLMWGARGGEPGAMSQAFKGILLTIAVTGAGALVISVLNSAFDQWANHILNTGLDGVGVGKRISELSTAGTAAAGLGPVFEVVLFLLAALASLAQFGLMLVRAPVEVLLCVIWPVTAASAVTKEGSEAFRRVTGWLLSWSIYKLAAAIVYATAFAMIGDSKDLTGTVEGTILLVLAVFALPALIRLITPAAQAVPGGGGQFMMAGASAGGQILGARMLMRSAGHGAQTHQVGKPSAFSGAGSNGAAAGAAGAAATGSGRPSPAASPQAQSGAGRDPTGAGTAGAGTGSAAGAGAGAAGPAGAGAATARQAAQMAQQQAAGAIGATDTTTRGDAHD